MRIWGITDTGLVRCENQDSYATAVVADCTVAVVCDGMGGHQWRPIPPAVSLSRRFCRSWKRR